MKISKNKLHIISKAASLMITLLFCGLIVVALWYFLKNQNIFTSNQSANKDKFECYINGELILTTREKCREKSRQAKQSYSSPQSPPETEEKVNWGGPELWTAVNKRREQLGVNPLQNRGELCTIAAIRLNQLLQLGKLDAHAGFEPTLRREDLAWISQKYSSISEFLVVGYQTPEETVAAWEHTLGHKTLLSGGEYVWGCIYSQDTFGVAIVAF